MDYTGVGVVVIIVSSILIVLSVIYAKYIYIIGFILFHVIVHYLYAVFVGRETGDEFEIGDETGEEFYVQTLSGGVRID